jgi:hypothetical protein
MNPLYRSSGLLSLGALWEEDAHVQAVDPSLAATWAWEDPERQFTARLRPPLRHDRVRVPEQRDSVAYEDAVRVLVFKERLKVSPQPAVSVRHQIYRSPGAPLVHVLVLGQLLHPLTVLALRALYAQARRLPFGLSIEFRSLPPSLVAGMTVPGYWQLSAADAAALATVDRWLYVLQVLSPADARDFVELALFDPGRVHGAALGRSRPGDGMAVVLRGLGVRADLFQAMVAAGGYHDGARFHAFDSDCACNVSLSKWLEISGWPAVVVNGVEIDPLEIQGPLFDYPGVFQNDPAVSTD